jgi:hypothetical protein
MIRLFTFALLVALLTACSSGKTALRQGDFDAAVAKAANRFQRKPDHKHARFVLEEAFELAYNRHQQTIQAIGHSQEPFRWERAVTAYTQLQKTTDIARRSGLDWANKYPASYTQNLTEVRTLAAADRYEAAEQAFPYHKDNLQAARDAHDNYIRANALEQNYRDACAKAEAVLPYAILRVVVEPLTPSMELDRSETRDLQNEIFRRVGQRSSPSPLSRIYMADPDAGEGFPMHQTVQMVVSNYNPWRDNISSNCQTVESNETYVVGKKKINDTTFVDIREKVKGTLTTYRRDVTAYMTLRIRAIDRASGAVAWKDELSRSCEWHTEWQTFTGDNRALNSHTLSTASIFVPSAWSFFDDLTSGIAADIKSELHRRYD